MGEANCTWEQAAATSKENLLAFVRTGIPVYDPGGGDTQ